MRRIAIALCLFTAMGVRAQSSCPTTAPAGFAAHLDVCTPSSPCLAGTSVTLMPRPIVPDCPAPPPGSPPPPSCSIYQIQSCDQLTWTFGDGTPPVVGAMTMSHTYASAGVYHPSVTISNSLGSGQIAIVDSVIVASNPPTYVDFSPSAITVPETAGSITFTLVRSGNLDTTATVHYAHAAVHQGEAIGGDVTFAPGETTKSFTMKVFDDHAYSDAVVGWVGATAADGTVFHTSSAQYTLTETDPQPTATVADVRVPEGAGTADVVVNLSGPFGGWISFQGLLTDGTANVDSDYGTYAYCSVEPGARQCVLHIPIVDDDVPEADETFTVRVEKRYSPVAPNFLRDTATVTIVNDDAALTPVAQPSSIRLRPGTEGTVKVSLQPPSSSPQSVTLWSTRPDVVTVPESLTIPAGGSATFDAYALAGGTAAIWIVAAGGVSLQVEVTVAVPRRRATR